MKKSILILFLALFSFSCSFQRKPVVVSPKKTNNFAGSLRVALYCENGTSFKGKAIVKYSPDYSYIKVYSSTGMFVGYIKIKENGIFSSEDLAVAARYIRGNSHVKELFSGWIDGEENKKELDIKRFGNLKEMYYYENGKIKKVIITDSVCEIDMEPLKVKKLSALGNK